MKLWPALLMMFLVVGLVFVSGCAKKETTEENKTVVENKTTTPTQNITKPTPIIIPAEEEAITSPTFDDTDTDFGDLI